MKVTDALTHLRATTDQTHKFWGYYQAVTVAGITFAWASANPSPRTIIGLIFAYAIFAFLNCRLIRLSQETALAIWNAIQSYASPPPQGDPIDPRLMPLLALNKPDSPQQVTLMHLAISVLAALAMYARIVQTSTS